MALTPERIFDIAEPFVKAIGDSANHVHAIPDDGRVEAFARAVEAEVRKADDALIQQLATALANAHHDRAPYGEAEAALAAARAHLTPCPGQRQPE